MIFPKDFPEKLRSSILVSEVVGKKVKLKLRGKEFSGLCPFHNEKSPSFTVNDQKGFYHCFGCAAHGDVISFVMQSEGFSYPEAVKKLSDDFSIPIPQVKFDEAKEEKLSRDLLLLENICQFFQKNLLSQNGQEALSYLRKRDISSENIKKFRLGFALNSYEALTKYLQEQGFAEQEIARSGVIGVNEQKKFYDKFRNRVIFPITNKKGQVIAFGGRTISDDLPKYLNSAETDIFKKNQTLYNFHFARKPIFSKGYAVVVEGYMDAISLFMNGIENVVAGLGTALGQEHLKELFFTTDNIIICLDGDAAGIRAAKRVSELALPLINAKKNINFTFLPNQLDPDDFVKKIGTKELEKLFKQATPLSQSLFDFALIELGVERKDKISAEMKAKIEANLNAKVATILDATSKKHFSYFFKDLLFALGKNFSKNSSKSVEKDNNFTNKNYNKISSNASKNQAIAIIALIIKFPELANFHDENFDIKNTQLVSEEMTNLKELLIELIEENQEFQTKDLIAALENSVSSNDLSELKNVLASISMVTLDYAKSKLSTLLLKDLLLQVESQYQEARSKIDEIETHQSAITNQKIKEIFNYKKSLEQKILLLEKDFS
ncbi:MAG: DNA primase [Proteobacteria bacterium]|nr:DNA primase [Pseudomonadota bacterium]